MTRLPPALFLALRALRPRRTFVSVITVISVVGVMLGVMVMIIVISVMSGFHRELRNKVLGLNSHLTITAGGPIRKWEEIARLVGLRPHVRGVAPFIQGPVLARCNGRISTPVMRGIDPVRENQVSRVAQYIVAGALDLDGEKIVVGIELARRHGIEVGDKMTIYSPKNLENRKVAHLPAEPTVTGIFESGMFEYDSHLILCSLESGQDYYTLGQGVHGLAVMTDDLESVVRVQQDLNRILKPPLGAQTWMEANRQLFSTVAVEKNVEFFLLFFIVIVAAFGIMSTLITVTVQKRREIGILKSIGATPVNILNVFLIQGVIVGIIGTGLGVGLGLTLIYYRNEFLEFMRLKTGYELFPREFYNFDQLPAQTSLSDLLIVSGSAFLICSLAGLFPAWRAARLQPAQALRDL